MVGKEAGRDTQSAEDRCKCLFFFIFQKALYLSTHFHEHAFVWTLSTWVAKTLPGICETSHTARTFCEFHSFLWKCTELSQSWKVRVWKALLLWGLTAQSCAWNFCCSIHYSNWMMIRSHLIPSSVFNSIPSLVGLGSRVWKWRLLTDEGWSRMNY